MNIEGTYTLQASPESIWQSLMDAQVLQRAIPGVERLAKVGDDTYEIALQIKQTPFVGRYQGTITISEQQYPYQYRMTIQGEGRQETINASGSIHLNGRDSTTIIAYKGILTPGKRSALLPPTLVRGAARHFIQQFFSALAEQLRATASSRVEIVDAEETTSLHTLKQPGGTIVIVPPPKAAQRTSILPTLPTLLTLIRWCGLGEGDPVEEARWESRIRRAGLISGFLLLVWVGTRLPRKAIKQVEEHP